MCANLSYEDVEIRVWAIPKLTDFLGIGHRMEKPLNNMRIYSIKGLANFNPDIFRSQWLLWEWVSGFMLTALMKVMFINPIKQNQNVWEA